MLFSVMTALGGLGLFLIGMHLMTNGLRQLAGSHLRQFIKTSTRTPVTGAASGALTTAILQSSSATTVATVGFVSAGLMTFPQALGVIFGANIGTTITGWMVAILGFKLQLSLAAQPLAFAGILVHLFGRGRWRAAGLTLAGFSVLFIGIDTLTAGFSILQGTVTPDDFPNDTLLGRFQLVGIGVAITLVTQSSSAGVATALAALTARTISFPQAAALVIGMDVGTTATAAFATIGASTASRRTGYAHVNYNFMTGIMAFFLLSPLGWFVSTMNGNFDPQLALVGFHSAFNLIGVLLVIGFTQKFSQLVIYLVPAQATDPALRLDDHLLTDPAAALDASQGAISDQAKLLFQSVSTQISNARPEKDQNIPSYTQTIRAMRRYAEKIRTDPADASLHSRHLALLHALDHMERLVGRLQQQERILLITETPHLAGLATQLSGVIGQWTQNGSNTSVLSEKLNNLRRVYRQERRTYRDATLDLASRNEIDLESALARLDAVRWLHRSSYHIWRISIHLTAAETGKSLDDTEQTEAQMENALDEDL